MKQCSAACYLPGPRRLPAELVVNGDAELPLELTFLCSFPRVMRSGESCQFKQHPPFCSGVAEHADGLSSAAALGMPGFQAGAEAEGLGADLVKNIQGQSPMCLF